ncbi:MAG: hypothetical protein K6B70_07900 [Clostridia bacterium]|nr:hypothetical protein [Clostridia bacterium]
MSKLYIITGPAGVGKSTVSKKLADNLSKSALIEGDDIYHQVVGGYTPAWKDGNHLDVFWKICINTMKTYLESGYDVVFNYIINLETLELIKNNLNGFEIKFTLLLVDEETLLARDSLRDEDCQMKERCIVLLNNFKNKGFNKKNILDSSHLTIDETVNIIEEEKRFEL